MGTEIKTGTETETGSDDGDRGKEAGTGVEAKARHMYPPPPHMTHVSSSSS
jgi:hypothetical protein